MFMRPLLRFVPDNTRIHFMRARFWGLAGSFILSTISIGLFFYPGLNLGIDFKGGIVMEVTTPAPADIASLRAAFIRDRIQLAGLQTFGGPRDLLVRLDTQPSEGGNQALQTQVRATLARTVPGSVVQRADVVGASVSDELFTDGMLALAISLAMIMAYIWFRFEWQFAVGAVVTLLLDVTKTIGLSGDHANSVRPGDGRRHPYDHRLIRPTTRSWSTTACAKTCASTNRCRYAILSTSPSTKR